MGMTLKELLTKGEGTLTAGEAKTLASQCRTFFFFRCSSAAFSPFQQNFPYIQAGSKKHQSSHFGVSGAVHNIASPSGRRVRGFVGIEPLVHPCP